MPRPGVDVILTEAAPVGGAILDTGQTFMVGLSERGPTVVPAEIRSLRSYERRCGGRSGGQLAHDSVRAYFTEGGAVLYYLRLSGPGAAAATGTVGPLEVTAASTGTWGNSVTVSIEADPTPLGAQLAQIAAPTTTSTTTAAPIDIDTGEVVDVVDEEPAAPLAGPLLRVVVRRNGIPVERSPLIDTAQDAVNWASSFSDYLTVTAATPTAPLAVVTPVTLAGGADDTNITPQVLAGTLNHFGFALGPGQVIYPGATDAASQAAILAHCWEMRRCALLDLQDTDDLTVAADVVALYQNEGARLAAALAPRLQYPGPAATTTVLVPYSAVQAGVIARRDRATGNPNEPAAGDNAWTRARGLNTQFTDDSREELNELGVTLARQRGRPARVYTYGSRTCAGPDQPNWQWFGGSRLVMAVTHEANDAAEQFVHRQIDPQGRIFIELESALTAILERYFQLGALYGATAEEAYNVDTSNAVNTPETIANGEIHAHIWVATSPSAEWVLIEIAKLSSLAMAA